MQICHVPSVVLIQPLSSGAKEQDKYISRVSDQNEASLLSVLSRKTDLKVWSFGECSPLTPVT